MTSTSGSSLVHNHEMCWPANSLLSISCYKP